MLEDATLADNTVSLEPMAITHLDALCEIGLNPDIWRWYTYTIAAREDMLHMMTTVLASKKEGTWFPFVTRDVATGRIIGSTSYLNISLPHKRLEIGSTWITPAFQRIAINTHAKFLMLQHAFEHLGLNRVEFKTDSLNTKSRAAILRIGATQEAILRAHMICDDGRLRDSVYFSIIRSEWPAVKVRLQHMMTARPQP
ncbi:MAG TPA: GNAT family protein [Phycisphaerales bacterium]|nr:GNAT family protein [Phycisphaerales bacterium]